MIQTTGIARPMGNLGLRIIKGFNGGPVVRPRESLKLVWRHGFPHADLDPIVNRWRARNLQNLRRKLLRILIAEKLGIPFLQSDLFLEKIFGNDRRLFLGLASLRVVTDDGVAAIVDAFQNTVEVENFKFHGFGTGTGNEAAGDTALGTELTTEYATDNVRPTGSQTEGATANIYRTVGTLSPDSGGTLAITEHGIFSQAATGGGILLDRSKFAAVNLVAGADSLQATYDLTFTSGG